LGFRIFPPLGLKMTRENLVIEFSRVISMDNMLTF
jgi:hypothetical protein